MLDQYNQFAHLVAMDSLILLGLLQWHVKPNDLKGVVESLNCATGQLSKSPLQELEEIFGVLQNTAADNTTIQTLVKRIQSMLQQIQKNTTQ